LLQVASNNFHSVTYRGRLALNVGGGTSLCRRFRGFKLWVLERLNFQFQSPKQPKNIIRFESNLESSGLSNEKGPVSDSSSILRAPDGVLPSNLPLFTSLVIFAPVSSTVLKFATCFFHDVCSHR